MDLPLAELPALARFRCYCDVIGNQEAINELRYCADNGHLVISLHAEAGGGANARYVSRLSNFDSLTAYLVGQSGVAFNFLIAEISFSGSDVQSLTCSVSDGHAFYLTVGSFEEIGFQPSGERLKALSVEEAIWEVSRDKFPGSIKVNSMIHPIGQAFLFEALRPKPGM